MLKPERRTRTILLGAIAVAAAASGLVIWSTVAGANPKSEPATFSAKEERSGLRVERGIHAFFDPRNGVSGRLRALER